MIRQWMYNKIEKKTTRTICICSADLHYAQVSKTKRSNMDLSREIPNSNHLHYPFNLKRSNKVPSGATLCNVHYIYPTAKQIHRW